MELSDLLILAACFFCIATVYSSVGFGGGSSYLALLAVMEMEVDFIRPVALLCNIIVVSAGTYIFWRSGALDVRRSFWFLVASIPMAFLGGYWKIDDARVFFILLGSTLVLASILLWLQPKEETHQSQEFEKPALNALLGGGIGFLSGLVSIGGGIFLAPVLHLLRWGAARKISALASLFILVNSISGLAGQITRAKTFDWPYILPLLVAVFLGGQIGSRLGARKFNPLYIKRITAVVIFVAAFKILADNLGQLDLS